MRMPEAFHVALARHEQRVMATRHGVFSAHSGGLSPFYRVADVTDVRLRCTEAIFAETLPLITRLRLRILGRRGYERLTASFVAHAMATGQVDATENILRVIDERWRLCPARHIPVLPPPQSSR